MNNRNASLYAPRKDAAAASQTPTPTDTAIAPSQADSATISKKAKAELQKFQNDLRKEKILEQEGRLKMLIAQVLSQNPRSPLGIDEVYSLWEKYNNAEKSLDKASKEIVEDLEKILQDNASTDITAPSS